MCAIQRGYLRYDVYRIPKSIRDNRAMQLSTLQACAQDEESTALHCFNWTNVLVTRRPKGNERFCRVLDLLFEYSARNIIVT